MHKNSKLNKMFFFQKVLQGELEIKMDFQSPAAFERFTVKQHVACTKRGAPTHSLICFVFTLLFVEVQAFSLLSVYVFCFWKLCDKVKTMRGDLALS